MVPNKKNYNLDPINCRNNKKRNRSSTLHIITIQTQTCFTVWSFTSIVTVAFVRLPPFNRELAKCSSESSRGHIQDWTFCEQSSTIGCDGNSFFHYSCIVVFRIGHVEFITILRIRLHCSIFFLLHCDSSQSSFNLSSRWAAVTSLNTKILFVNHPS